MALIKDQYLAMLKALLPGGLAWTRKVGSNLSNLLEAFAQEFERLDGRAELLINESDIRTTSELLPDWERVAGLPDACTDLAASQDARRQNLVTKISGRRANDKQYYIDMATQLGYSITIEELITPYETGHLLNGVEITAAEWVFVWRINAPVDTAVWARAGSAVAGDPIRTWGDELIECVINNLKPAHTHVLFAYA